MLREAIDDVSRAIELERADWRKDHAYHDRAGLYVKLKQFDAALADCNICIEKDPSDWTHYPVRSEVYAAMGDAAAARSDYDRSMDLNQSINR